MLAFRTSPLAFRTSSLALARRTGRPTPAPCAGPPAENTTGGRPKWGRNLKFFGRI
jgi:hypothetical protein